MPGTEFYTDLGLNSDLFSITGINGSSVSIRARGGATASAWASGVRWATPSVRTTGTGTGPTPRSWTTTTARPSLSTLPGSAGQPSGGVGGYWINAADGGVFSFGNAQFHGSMGGMRVERTRSSASRRPTTPTGYWEVATRRWRVQLRRRQLLRQHRQHPIEQADGRDGGHARRGWLLARGRPTVASSPTATPASTAARAASRSTSRSSGWCRRTTAVGYWLIASDGGVFAFGDAGFFGSLGGAPPVHGARRRGADARRWRVLGPRRQRHGLRLRRRPTVGVAGVSPTLSTMKSPMTGLIPDFSGQGFDAVNGGGQAFAFGDAPYFGDVTTAVPGYSGHAVGIAVTPS